MKTTIGYSPIVISAHNGRLFSNQVINWFEHRKI